MRERVRERGGKLERKEGEEAAAVKKKKKKKERKKRKEKKERWWRRRPWPGRGLGSRRRRPRLAWLRAKGAAPPLVGGSVQRERER